MSNDAAPPKCAENALNGFGPEENIAASLSKVVAHGPDTFFSITSEAEGLTAAYCYRLTPDSDGTFATWTRKSVGKRYEPDDDPRRRPAEESERAALFGAREVF